MSAILILNEVGEPIIQKSYRGDVPLDCHKIFFKYIKDDNNYVKPPFFNHDQMSFLYMVHEDLYLMIVSRENDNAFMLMSYLNKIVSVFEDYFNTFTEESLKKNFVLVYELLDEMMDFGFPQTTQASVLKRYVCTKKKFKLKDPTPPSTVTSAVSWRSDGISYGKNEVFLDVIEKLNLMVNQHGKVIRSEIDGRIKMKSFLSGMPELKLGLNDKLILSNMTKRTSPAKGIELDDIKFHQCVRLSRFETDRTISFIPPDGEFELMSYRLDTHVRPLFTIRVKTDYKKLRRVSYNISIKSEFKRVSYANNVKVIVPVPSDADSPQFDSITGQAIYSPAKKVFIWEIEQFKGSSHYTLNAKFGLSKIASEEEEPSKNETPFVSLNFDIPYYTVSGIQVRYLKIFEKSGYGALPWVRYATRHGNYIIKMEPFEEK